MTHHGTEFHYRFGWLARLFGSADYNEIVLADGVLRLERRDGGTEALVPDDLVPQISHRKRFCWDSLSFRHRDGRHVRVAGIRRAEAQTLGRMLEAWVAPVRERYFAELERRLQAAEALSRSCWADPATSGAASVAAAGLLRASIAEIAELSEVSGAPPALVERAARLQRLTESLSGEVAQANERFVSAELTRHSSLFDTVESKPLTAAQRRACVIDDDHNLVLAGAGTGKTSVMIGRAGYLLAAGITRPESLLMVAYNRDAAQELRERAARRLEGVADVERLTIKTFHALGLDLIAEAEGVRPSLSILAEDSHALSRFVTEQLDDLLRELGYVGKFIEYGFDQQEPDRSIFDFASLEEYERELARLDLRTFRGERVKSQEELRLANFLTRNGIDYRYEEPFPVVTATQERRQYRPDFTILREQAGAGPLFLEHFGIDENGNPPPFFGEASARSYREQIAWKRALYQRERLPLVETYSYEFRQGVVFDRLREKLAAQGIESDPRSDGECLDILRDAGIVSATAQFFAGLIPLVRERGLCHATVEQRIAAMPGREHRRARLLWELLQPVVERYERELAQRGEIDFADMVRRATEYVASGKVQSPFTHLLVDEFQDISAPRAELVLALARSRLGFERVLCRRRLAVDLPVRRQRYTLHQPVRHLRGSGDHHRSGSDVPVQRPDRPGRLPVRDPQSGADEEEHREPDGRRSTGGLAGADRGAGARTRRGADAHRRDGEAPRHAILGVRAGSLLVRAGGASKCVARPVRWSLSWARRRQVQHRARGQGTGGGFRCRGRARGGPQWVPAGQARRFVPGDVRAHEGGVPVCRRASALLCGVDAGAASRLPAV